MDIWGLDIKSQGLRGWSLAASAEEQPRGGSWAVRCGGMLQARGPKSLILWFLLEAGSQVGLCSQIDPSRWMLGRGLGGKHPRKTPRLRWPVTAPPQVPREGSARAGRLRLRFRLRLRHLRHLAHSLFLVVCPWTKCLGPGGGMWSSCHTTRLK